jgi:hypothetical protein
MAGRKSHLIKIIVLASGSNTFLGRYHSAMGAGFQSREYIFELHHTGICEEKAGISLRYNTTGFHNVVTIPFEKR